MPPVLFLVKYWRSTAFPVGRTDLWCSEQQMLIHHNIKSSTWMRRMCTCIRCCDMIIITVACHSLKEANWASQGSTNFLPCSHRRPSSKSLCSSVGAEAKHLGAAGRLWGAVRCWREAVLPERETVTFPSTWITSPRNRLMEGGRSPAPPQDTPLFSVGDRG